MSATMPRAREEESLILWCRLLEPSDDSAIEAFSARLRRVGGEECARIGRSVVMRYELPEVHAAFEEAIHALRDPELRCSIGAAIGSRDGAIDRAQILAAHAPRNTILSGANCAALLGDVFLFDPPAAPPSELPGAMLVDPRAPLLRERRASIARLNFPRLPPALRPLLRSLDELARRGEGALIFLKGSANSGVDHLIARFASHLRPSFSLALRSVPLGLEPLASLRIALARGGRAEGEELKRLKALSTLMSGEPRPLSEISEALIEAFKVHEGARPGLIFLDPLGGADPESERLAVETLRESRALLIARVPSDREPPAALHGRLPDATLAMPPLNDADALSFAAAILGAAEDNPAAAFLASTQDAQLGDLIEAARAFVLSGALRHDGSGFILNPSTASAAIGAPIELATHHIERLEDRPLKLLEITALVAPGTNDAIILGAARLDELSEGEVDAAIAQLRDEGLLLKDQLCPSSSTLRAATLRAMSQSRRAELHRTIAAASAQSDDGPLSAITRATHLRAGGRSSDAAELLISAAESAISLGSEATLNRILAKAIEWDPAASTRRRAHELAQRSQPAYDRTQALIDAFTSDQLGRAETIIDAAITEGLDLEIAAGLRALIETRRGAPLAARRQLETRSLETSRGRWVHAFTTLFSDLDLAIDEFFALLRDARRASSADDEDAALLGIALALDAQGLRPEPLVQRLKASRIASSKSR